MFPNPKSFISASESDKRREISISLVCTAGERSQCRSCCLSWALGSARISISHLVKAFRTMPSIKANKRRRRYACLRSKWPALGFRCPRQNLFSGALPKSPAIHLGGRRVRDRAAAAHVMNKSLAARAQPILFTRRNYQPHKSAAPFLFAPQKAEFRARAAFNPAGRSGYQ